MRKGKRKKSQKKTLFRESLCRGKQKHAYSNIKSLSVYVPYMGLNKLTIFDMSMSVYQMQFS